MDERPVISNSKIERCGPWRPRRPDSSSQREQQPTHLDLFSGIGGFALAAQWAGFRTIGFCEIDKYCQKVLAKNFLAHPRCKLQSWSVKQGTNGLEGGEQYANQSQRSDSPPIFGNIFDLDGRDFYGVSLITGGFPCQPFSVAGKRRGAEDDRHLWPEMLRVVNEARPAWVLGENVPGIIPMELDNVLSDLESIGYATRSFVIPACAVDARHRRDRLWIVGRLLENPWGNGESRRATRPEPSKGEQSSCEVERPSGISNANSKGLEGQRKIACGTGTQFDDTGDYCRWLPEPELGRVANGIPSRVDRLKGLGNAIVPQVAYEILREIRQMIACPTANEKVCEPHLNKK